MSPPPTSIDGTDITGATIDGQDVEEITIDGQTVFTGAPPLPSGRFAHWKFDEGSGSTAFDSAGSLDGTLENGANFVSNANLLGGFGLDFSGNSVYLGFNSKPNRFTTPHNNEFTIALTVNDAASLERDDTFVAWNTDTSAARFGVENNDISIRINDSSNQTRVGAFGSSVPSSGKLRIAAVWDFGADSMHLNTQKFTGAGIAASKNGGGDPMRIGARQDNNGKPFNGIMDNVVFYDRALSDAEVQQDFDAQPWS